ncbi:hypothetical protein RJ639_036878 [Escallonia herrerae]|uniref:F-box domain-containing protein n=1 Tax=Escallonia herrerae TaxID=1293975 RepID=A0AA88WUH0_9ASTE|nr:hypothetical protein RJ639_036878 [Escallonia herrerae]
MASGSLSIDLLCNILLRLPLETLITITAVCKLWYSLIHDSTFITLHLNSTNPCGNSNGNFLIMSPSFEHICSLRCGKALAGLSRFRIPFGGSSSCFRIVGGLNGLLCITEGFGRNFGRTIFLRNPSIRKFKTLESSCFTDDLLDTRTRVVLGFSFDQGTNDYKIVRIMYFLDGSSNYLGETPPVAEVYSLRLDSWRTIGDDVPFLASDKFSKAIFHGAIHWLASESQEVQAEVIMSFRTGDEAFQEILMPNCDPDGFGIDRCNIQLEFIKDLGEADLILGIKIIRSQHRIVLTQSSYIEKILKRFTCALPRSGFAYSNPN